LVTVLPGVMIPQSIVDRLFVHALSEYMPRFGVEVIEPLEDKVLLTLSAPLLSAPYVVNVRTNAIKNNTIIDIEIFRDSNPFHISRYVVSLNKHYDI
jgi:hypothetical protein